MTNCSKIDEIDEIDVHKDWFNRNGFRNADNTDIILYNCGGYALGTYSWYTPYPNGFDREDIKDIVVDSYLHGNSYDETTDKLLEIFEKQMLSDFSTLRPFTGCVEDYIEKDNEELIAFRIFFDIEFYDEDISEIDFFDYDFHYQVLRNGKWREKCGAGPIELCESDYWITKDGAYSYDSEIRYYVRTLK